MNEAEVEEQLRLLQRQAVLAGEAVDTLKRDHRVAIDTLRLEIEVLQRCILLLHPEMQERLSALRAEVLEQVDPEAT